MIGIIYRNSTALSNVCLGLMFVWVLCSRRFCSVPQTRGRARCRIHRLQAGGTDPWSLPCRCCIRRVEQNRAQWLLRIPRCLSWSIRSLKDTSHPGSTRVWPKGRKHVVRGFRVVMHSVMVIVALCFTESTIPGERFHCEYSVYNSASVFKIEWNIFRILWSRKYFFR